MNWKNMKSMLLTVGALCLIAPVTVVACGDDDGAGTSGDTTNNPDPDPDPQSNNGICLMNNCSSDAECGGCGDGRRTCLVAEQRCVACNPNDGSGCPEGESCSSFGICAPQGQQCLSDDRGEPTVTCTVNKDCAACDPMHQVCDTSTGQCQACLGTNTDHCLSADICLNGDCSAKCPQACDMDADCGQCPGAMACNNRKCSECSETTPCAEGLTCDSGKCVPQCGQTGQATGTCFADDDCGGCGDADGSWQCKKAVNQNGPNDPGSCAPAATGCADLGTTAVLPAPYDQVTNLCSEDADCAGVSVNLNVGELIRDAIGTDSINLGLTDVAIGDAYVDYDMGECAEVDLVGDTTCGVCVPCKKDSDCEPIAVDPLVMDIFAGQTLAQLAGVLLIDYLYGDNAEHNLNFQCQMVAAGYGVCSPCSNPFQACGQPDPPSGGGSCDHAACDAGPALDPSCGSCEASVCAADAYCCTTEWDALCVSLVASECGPAAACDGGSTCEHSACQQGVMLEDDCDTCVGDVCDQDAYCCTTEWDSLCTDLAEASASCSCPAP